MPRPPVLAAALVCLALLVPPLALAAPAGAQTVPDVTLPEPGAGVSTDLELSATELDGTVDLSLDELPSDGAVHVAVVARRTPVAEYRLTAILGSNGSVRLSLSRVVNGDEVPLGTDETVDGLVHTAGDVLRMRFQVTGTGTTTLAATLWNTVAPEPAAPQVVRTDDTPQLQGGGEVGVESYLSRAATNAPLRLGVDRLVLPGAVAEPPEVVAADEATTVLHATFDGLAAGPLSAAEFREELGGGNRDEAPFEDSGIVADPRGSGKVYRLTLDAGSFKNYPAGNNGIVTFVPLGEQLDNACITYDIRFSAGFDWSLGGKLPGLQGTAPGVPLATPTGGGNPGARGWSSRGMWVGPEAYSWAAPTNMAVSYVYGPGQRDYYGDNLLWNRPFLPGVWHRMTQCHTMNTPGAADGTLEAWMDGVKVLDIRDHVYRLRGDVGVSHLNWSIFRGGNDREWAGATTGHVDIDDVVVTTR